MRIAITTLILISSLFLISRALHLSPAPRPNNAWTNSDGTQWTGYNPDCALSCQQSFGEVCDSYPRSCCARGECVAQFGVRLCRTPLPLFSCKNPVKRGVVYSNPKVPGLKFLNQ